MKYNYGEMSYRNIIPEELLYFWFVRLYFNPQTATGSGFLRNRIYFYTLSCYVIRDALT